MTVKNQSEDHRQALAGVEDLLKQGKVNEAKGLLKNLGAQYPEMHNEVDALALRLEFSRVSYVRTDGGLCLHKCKKLL